MVENLIRRARSRFIVNEALSRLALAGAIAIGGLALLLVLGTRYLEWWTLVLAVLAGLGYGAFRVYRAVPGEYATAVRLDSNAGLSDALSTALYFSTHGSAHGSDSAFRGAQREHAEAAARGVDLDRAIPFTFPRALYAMAALALLASGLVLLRYRVAHTLDLRPPLTEMMFEDQAVRQGRKANPAARDAAKQKRMDTAESLLARLGVPVNPEERQQQAALDKAIDQALEGPGAAAEKGQKGDPGGKNGQAGSGLDKSPDGDPLEGKSAEGGSKADDAKPSGDQQGSPGDKGGPKSGSPGENSSLMSKLKDAVSNMFAKPGDDKKSGAGQKGQQQQPGQSAKSEKGTGEKGSAGKGEEKGQSQSDAQDGEPTGDAQEGQQAQGKAGSKGSQQSAQAGSGVGSQDGAKDLKAAEQLKAMGKISEIIGKRAATVTGETTIEVQSGNQQLRTAYSNRTASHAESDSDVTRDEIPVALQSYVQEYFRQARKTAPERGKPGAVKAPAPASTTPTPN